MLKTISRCDPITPLTGTRCVNLCMLQDIQSSDYRQNTQTCVLGHHDSKLSAWLMYVSFMYDRIQTKDLSTVRKQEIRFRQRSYPLSPTER